MAAEISEFLEERRGLIRYALVKLASGLPGPSEHAKEQCDAVEEEQGEEG